MHQREHLSAQIPPLSPLVNNRRALDKVRAYLRGAAAGGVATLQLALFNNVKVPEGTGEVDQGGVGGEGRVVANQG